MINSLLKNMERLQQINSELDRINNDASYLEAKTREIFPDSFNQKIMNDFNAELANIFKTAK